MDLMQRRRELLLGGKPYDAEIKYLESKKNATYIDTGYLGNEKTSFELKFVYLGAGQAIFGSRSTNNNAVIVANTNARMGNKNALVRLSANTLYTAFLDKNSYVLNGTSYTLGASTFTTNNSIQLFAANTTTVSIGQARIYYFKMWEDGALIRDYIPVRVGTTGYMYDKVSGQLFGNVGTGDFILGNDI